MMVMRLLLKAVGYWSHGYSIPKHVVRLVETTSFISKKGILKNERPELWSFDREKGVLKLQSKASNVFNKALRIQLSNDGRETANRECTKSEEIGLDKKVVVIICCKMLSYIGPIIWTLFGRRKKHPKILDHRFSFLYFHFLLLRNYSPSRWLTFKEGKGNLDLSHVLLGLETICLILCSK